MKKLAFGVCCLCLGLAAVVAAPPNLQKPDATKGKTLFVQHCSSCHYADRAETKVGPGLKGLFTRPKLVTGATVNAANVKQLIENGRDGMPPFKSVLSTSQIDDVIAFLKTI